VRVLLDEMLPAVVAQQLRNRGHDILAVDERLDLRGLPDDELFEHAQRDARAIVTYNRDDFLTLDHRFRHAGRDHHGIIILSPRRFAQGTQTIGALVTSLDAFLTAEPPYPGFVHWLR
jgi:predicted nuclease of predicted toxin-antitoxin system